MGEAGSVSSRGRPVVRCSIITQSPLWRKERDSKGVSQVELNSEDAFFCCPYPGRSPPCNLTAQNEKDNNGVINLETKLSL